MRGARLALVTVALLVAACTSPVDLKQAIEVTDVTTGWFDAGIVNGKNKLVPSVTFRLKKPPDLGVPSLSLNLIFKAEGQTDPFAEVYVPRVDFIDGMQTAPTVVRPENGYTGDPPQSRQDMLKNSQFVDVNVTVFGKQSASQWTELHRTKVDRQLITQ
jgi:hypothetical protein